MAFLRLSLLGAPHIERDGQHLHFERRHALALGIYLAVSGISHSRDALSTLFWPQADPSAGRANLRRTLHILGRTVGHDFVEMENGHVRLHQDGNLWIDLSEFRRLVARCHQHGHPAHEVCNDCLPLLTQAVDLYRDDFLAGFTLPDSPDFDHWQFFQGEQLRAEMAFVLDLLQRGYTEQGHYTQAIVYAQRHLALDPLNEPTHRRLMQLYADTEQIGAAQRQYELCSRLLQAELAVAPSPETTALHQKIQSRRVSPNISARSLIPTTIPVQDDIRLISVVSVGLATHLNQAGLELAGRIESMLTLTTLVENAARSLGGRIEYGVGEDILAIFGHDHIHEDDAERAVRTALTIRQAAQDQRLGVQIGINTGMAYCRGQSGATGKSIIMGPVVNLAARLRDCAADGQILVGRQTYLPTRGLCDHLPTAVILPGVAGQTVYAVTRLRARTEKTRGVEGIHSELVGRRAEMARLHAAWRQLQSGSGSVVTLAGAAGVGKSRLMAELKKLVWAAPPTHSSIAGSGNSSPLWLEGRGLEHAMQTSYWLFVDLLRGYFGDHEADNGTAISQRVIATLHDLEQRGYLAWTEADEIGPLLGRLLALHFGNKWDQHLHSINADQVRQRMRLALQRLLAALARSRPLLLVLEDLHWADPLSLELITTLVESVPTLPLMLICLYRPEQAQAEESVAATARRACPERHIDLYLHELTPVESQQLVASLLATEQLPENLRQLMLDKSQGNPFFLEEWVRALMDAGVLYQEDGLWQAGDSIHGLAVPESVQSVILSRVDRLGTIPRQALQMAAVLGRIFRLRVLDAMTGSHPELAAALNHLQRQRFIYVERSQPDIEYSFHHVLAQNAIYQDLPKPRRVALHRDAGQALERIYGDHLDPYIEDLARHYDQSDLTDKAISYLLRAGQKAQQSTLNREALTYFKRALARIEMLTPDQPDPQQQLKAVRGMGEAYAGLGDLSQGEPYLRRAIEQAKVMDLPPAEQARLYIPLCHLLRWSGRFEDLFHLSRTGLALLGDDDESAEAVVLVAFVAVAAYLTGRRHQYRQLIGQVIPVLRHLPFGQHLFSAYGMASWWYRDAKQVDEAILWVETLAAEARQRNDLWTLGYLRSWPGYWLQEAVGDLDTILNNFQEALAIAEQIGDQVLRGYVLTFLGLVHWAIGNMDLAERMQREALAIHEQGKALHMQVLNRKGLGLIYLSHGDWTRAMETFERGWDDAKRIHYRVHGVRMTLLGLARAYLMQGRRQEAIPLYCKVAVEDEADADGQIWMACALAGLAEAIEDPFRLREVYRSIQATRSPADPLPLVQWWQEPCTPDTRYTEIDMPAFPATLESASNWRWCDPFGDCRWSVDEDGLTIYASNFFRDLWFNNQSAPRFLYKVEGDFAVQTICTPVTTDRPAMGGIVLWHDGANYLRLAWGAQGAEEITLLGCLDNRDLYLGRGHLPGAVAVHLRMEREDSNVRALCSVDDRTWFRIAAVPFPAEGALQVGPFVTGTQYSWLHPGITQRGTAMRFSSFQICH